MKNKEYSWGDDEGFARDYANYDGIDTWKYCASIGSFKPNGYGLFDMGEWCQDWYDSDKDVRVLRGGGSWDSTYDLRVAHRFGSLPTHGGATASGFDA